MSKISKSGNKIFRENSKIYRRKDFPLEIRKEFLRYRKRKRRRWMRVEGQVALCPISGQSTQSANGEYVE